MSSQKQLLFSLALILMFGLLVKSGSAQVILSPKTADEPIPTLKIPEPTLAVAATSSLPMTDADNVGVSFTDHSLTLSYAWSGCYMGEMTCLEFWEEYNKNK